MRSATPGLVVTVLVVILLLLLIVQLLYWEQKRPSRPSETKEAGAQG